MVKRWGKWPADWRGCGWRQYQINVINEMEDWFIKAQNKDRQMQERTTSQPGSKVVTSHGF